MYGNFWITGTLFIVGGYLFSRKHARLVVLVATLYALHCVKVQVGWSGIMVSINLAFISNDVLNCLLQWCDNLSEKRQFEEQNFPDSFIEDKFGAESEFFVPTDEAEKVKPTDKAEKLKPTNEAEKVKPTDETKTEKVQPIDEAETEKVQPSAEKVQSFRCTSKPASTTIVVNKQKEIASIAVVKDDANAVSEMKRILGCVDHYEALGLSRYKKIDAALLKKEYRKKVACFCFSSMNTLSLYS